VTLLALQTTYVYEFLFFSLKWNGRTGSPLASDHSFK
jgi:hypothetical protein